MRNKSVSVAALGIAAAFALAACSSSGGGGSTSAPPPAGTSPAGQETTTSAPATSAANTGGNAGGGGPVNGNGVKVGIILPDTTTSPRWVTADPTALKAACQKYNVSCNIQNAQGDTAKMKSIASQMLSQGVKYLMIVNLDQPSGAAIEKQATDAGVTPIDYDRLTLGGGAALYISFDGVEVGKAQGTALTQCPQVKNLKTVKYVEIDGAASDNNATLFNQGYESVLSKQPGWKLVSEQDGNWDAPTAGREFNAMLAKDPDIKAVMVANDTMAGAVITDLKRQHLNGKVAVSGQDATAAGLQAVMTGDQCFTIYKPSSEEAYPAIKAIAQLANGTVPATNATVTDTMTHKKVPAILAKPVIITQKNVAQPINDNYTPKNTVCIGQFVSLCNKFGVK